MITANVPKYVSEESGSFPPLGLLYIATYLNRNSLHTVEIYDAALHGLDKNLLCEKLTSIDIVGITTITFPIILIRVDTNLFLLGKIFRPK